MSQAEVYHTPSKKCAICLGDAADNPDNGNEKKKLREGNVWKVLRQTERRCQQADAEIGARWTGWWPAEDSTLVWVEGWGQKLKLLSKVSKVKLKYLSALSGIMHIHKTRRAQKQMQH